MSLRGDLSLRNKLSKQILRKNSYGGLLDGPTP